MESELWPKVIRGVCAGGGSGGGGECAGVGSVVSAVYAAAGDCGGRCCEKMSLFLAQSEETRGAAAEDGGCRRSG